MIFYLSLFILYSVQLAVYRRGIHDHAIHDDNSTQRYLVAVDSILLVQALIAVACGWVFRPVFENLSVVFNAILFGLTFGWLILAAPNASEHRIFYGLNASIVILLMMVDVSMLLYVRPEVIRVGGSQRRMEAPEQRAGRWNNLLNSYGKLRNRFLTEESRPMAEKADEEHGVEIDGPPTDRLSLEEEESVLGNYKIDVNDKAICEGFRINLAALPAFEGQSLPRDLLWDHFAQIQHIVDSSSCHIYTALWEGRPVVLKLIKAERVTSAVAVAEFEAEEGICKRL